MNDTIGERIKSARKERGLTQKGLAAQVGVPYQTIQYWENGRRNPKIDNLQKVADALDTDVNWLLRGSVAQQQAEFARHVLHKKSGAAKLSEVNRVFNTASDKSAETAAPEPAAPEPAGSVLSPLEVQLLEHFRSLNAAGQSVAVERLGELAQLPAYKKATETPESV